jgi:protein TonB
MVKKLDIFLSEWCELVFENRNKEYGAFRLRRNAARYHLIGILGAGFVFLLVFSLPSLIKKITEKQGEHDVSVRVLSEIQLEKPKEPENILKDLPPPPPPLRNTIKFTPPVIKPDEQVAEEEEPKLQQEVVETKSAIGVVDFDKGTDDVAAPLPVDDKAVSGEGTEEAPFVIVEQMPEFPGGERALLKYLSKNVQYPELAAENGISGIVMVNFVVDAEGNITQAKVARGIGGGCDEEALRVVNHMPKWKPGKQGGRAVKVYFTVPIRFVLSAK